VVLFWWCVGWSFLVSWVYVEALAMAHPRHQGPFPWAHVAAVLVGFWIVVWWWVWLVFFAVGALARACNLV
jgi:hypothetical protein